MASFQVDYPWTLHPLVVSAPMRLISKARLAVAVSRAGGIGFIGSGTETTTLKDDLAAAAQLLGAGWEEGQLMPIGIGFINWGSDLEAAVRAVERFRPAAVWLFATRDDSELLTWATEIRKASSLTKIWIQISTVEDAINATKLVQPDVLVIQGSDAGGHGLSSCASVISLLPEVADELASKNFVERYQYKSPQLVAAGGIADARGAVAALALGAEGIVMGTRYLGSHEAEIAHGYQKAVMESKDGGLNTVRSRLYDSLRGTTGWPDRYGGRGVINSSYRDAMKGMPEEDNKKLYEASLDLGDAGWGPDGRLTTYAGTAVGLVREVKTAAAITCEVIEESQQLMEKLSRRFKP